MDGGLGPEYFQFAANLLQQYTETNINNNSNNNNNNSNGGNHELNLNHTHEQDDNTAMFTDTDPSSLLLADSNTNNNHNPNSQFLSRSAFSLGLPNALNSSLKSDAMDDNNFQNLNESGYVSPPESSMSMSHAGAVKQQAANSNSGSTGGGYEFGRQYIQTGHSGPLSRNNSNDSGINLNSTLKPTSRSSPPIPPRSDGLFVQQQQHEQAILNQMPEHPVRRGAHRRTQSDVLAHETLNMGGDMAVGSFDFGPDAKGAADRLSNEALLSELMNLSAMAGTGPSDSPFCGMEGGAALGGLAGNPGSPLVTSGMDGGPELALGSHGSHQSSGTEGEDFGGPVGEGGVGGGGSPSLFGANLRTIGKGGGGSVGNSGFYSGSASGFNSDSGGFHGGGFHARSFSADEGLLVGFDSTPAGDILSSGEERGTTRRLRPDRGSDRGGSMEEMDGDEAVKKVLASKKFDDMRFMDAKRAKRILANRQSAARSKERKTRYISELEEKVAYFEKQAVAYKATLSLLQRETTTLAEANDGMSKKMQVMEKLYRQRDSENRQLHKEVEILRQATAMKGSSSSKTPPGLPPPQSSSSSQQKQQQLQQQQQQQPSLSGSTNLSLEQQVKILALMQMGPGGSSGTSLQQQLQQNNMDQQQQQQQQLHHQHQLHQQQQQQHQQQQRLRQFQQQQQQQQADDQQMAALQQLALKQQHLQQQQQLQQQQRPMQTQQQQQQQYQDDNLQMSALNNLLPFGNNHFGGLVKTEGRSGLDK
eukprot:TRINITY_DN186_c6_g1_i1.p1 TRINITY_DN186_c6_g1~~TRINITY_DN186_c6_g1_i1.p1  ORF type:complete len:759 (+),score=250.18 TRINITY_DN186_c6_g1_i1:1143-3419(+)